MCESTTPGNADTRSVAGEDQSTVSPFVHRRRATFAGPNVKGNTPSSPYNARTLQPCNLAEFDVAETRTTPKGFVVHMIPRTIPGENSATLHGGSNCATSACYLSTPVARHTDADPLRVITLDSYARSCRRRDVHAVRERPHSRSECADRQDRMFKPFLRLFSRGAEACAGSS
jgi:hypothetical protein